MLLHHGTTRERAEAIRDHGPCVVPRGKKPPEPFWQFSVAPATGPNAGLAEKAARDKAALLKREGRGDEGGPVIIELELSAEDERNLVAPLGELQPGKAWNGGPEITFDPGGGLEELQRLWPQLPKRIIDL